MELTFNSDTKHRKSWFTGVSFSHPAKMMLPLQLWIIDNYTQPGDVILDPMAGSGTLMVACSMGRHVICVELEKKFCDMMAGNWEKIQQRGAQLGYTMGTATIIQGDARNLEGILVDKIITSPPYARAVTGENGIDWSKGTRGKAEGNKPRDRSKEPGFNNMAIGGAGFKYSDSKDNLGNLHYGSIDSIITSPPYEEAIGEKHHSPAHERISKDKHWDTTYTERGRSDNIGNLKSDSYLEAMLQVYQQCFKVLKPQGLMILVTKNFIRNRQEVRLDEDTIKLCEQAGFTFQERHYRKLKSQSFWRTIYQQKYPDAPVLDKEDVLVFNK